jgi:hypothetical protein
MEINVVLADPRMKARLAELGGTMFAGSPAEFSSFIADETKKWARSGFVNNDVEALVDSRRDEIARE